MQGVCHLVGTLLILLQLENPRDCRFKVCATKHKWEGEKTTNIKKLGGTPPLLDRNHPMDVSHLSRGIVPFVARTFCPIYVEIHINLIQVRPGRTPTTKFLYVRTSSTTTKNRNLQFRGAVSIGGSPLDVLLFLQYVCAI